jgi:hypothetical protein
MAPPPLRSLHQLIGQTKDIDFSALLGGFFQPARPADEQGALQQAPGSSHHPQRDFNHGLDVADGHVEGFRAGLLGITVYGNAPATAFLPACMITFMNLADRHHQIGSGRISRLGTSRRRGIFSSLLQLALQNTARLSKFASTAQRFALVTSATHHRLTSKAPVLKTL